MFNYEFIDVRLIIQSDKIEYNSFICLNGLPKCNFTVDETIISISVAQKFLNCELELINKVFCHGIYLKVLKRTLFRADNFMIVVGKKTVNIFIIRRNTT